MAGAGTGPAAVPTNGAPQAGRIMPLNRNAMGQAQTVTGDYGRNPIVRATNQATTGPESLRGFGGPVNTNAPLNALELQPGMTPPFDPAGGPSAGFPPKQAPIPPAPVDAGARGGSIYDRASRGLSAAMGATGTELG